MPNTPKKECKNYKTLNESVEDTTKYGEFISSFDEWITPDFQRKRAEHLENTDYDQWSFEDEDV